MSDDLTVVSVEDAQGRILSGAGADPDQLADTMERHAPDEPAASPSQPSAAPVETSSEPKQTRGQKRFAELTSERDKAKNEAAAIAKERDELKQRLEAASRVTAPEAPKAPEPQKAKEKFPFTFDAYIAAHPDEDYDDFVTAKAVWTMQQQTGLSSQTDIDATIRRSIEADRASRTHADRLEQVKTRGRQAYADFDAVLAAPHVSANNWPIDKLTMLAELETPEHIQYALAKDPTLAETLRTEPNLIKFGMAIAQLMPKAAVAPLASTAPSGPVTPPAPYQPVGAGSKTTAPPLGDLPKKGGFDFDKSGYRERRAAERGVTRRR